MNILYLEENNFTGKTVSMELKEDPAFKNIHLACTKAAALKILSKKGQEINVALLDVMLKKDDESDRQGVAILRHIKSTPELKHIECVIYSRLDLPDVVHKTVMEYGAFDFINKGWNGEDGAKIKKTLKKAFKNSPLKEKPAPKVINLEPEKIYNF